MAKYTPTTDDVLKAWVKFRLYPERYDGAQGPFRAEFDRWLAEHDREVATKAVREWGQHQQHILDGMDMEPDADTSEEYWRGARDAAATLIITALHQGSV